MLASTNVSLTADRLFFGYTGRRGQPSFSLHDVSISVPRESLTGLIGPNGCGKTTLLKLLSGVLHAQQGAIALDGRAMRGIPRRELARHVAVVPQETHPAFDYT